MQSYTRQYNTIQDNTQQYKAHNTIQGKPTIHTYIKTIQGSQIQYNTIQEKSIRYNTGARTAYPPDTYTHTQADI